MFEKLKDKMRREAQAEDSKKFFEMTTPEAVGPWWKEPYTTETMGEAWKGSPKELKEGRSGYVYEYDPADDSYTIVKTKGGKTPTRMVKVTATSHPDAFAAIKQETAEISALRLQGESPWSRPMTPEEIEAAKPRPTTKPPAVAKTAAAPKKAPAAVSSAGVKAEAEAGQTTSAGKTRAQMEEDNRYAFSPIDVPEPKRSGASAPVAAPEESDFFRKYAALPSEVRHNLERVVDAMLTPVTPMGPKGGKLAYVDTKSSLGLYGKK